MKVLFITSSRIGDAVLSSGLLHHIEQRYPKAQVTIACGPLVASLFKGYPLLERILPIQKEKYNLHWVKLWREVMRTKWDVVIDLRNSAVSRIVWHALAYRYGPQIDKGLHKVQQNAKVMGLAASPSPKLWFTEDQKNKAAHYIPEGAPVIAVGPTANWAGKTWPAERFIEVIKWMTGKGGLFEGARVAVFAAPLEEEVAYEVLNSVPKSRRIDMVAKTDPGTAAACLERCDFYLGNDSGLMHCAAATGTPTFGLFGPSYPALYAPWGEHTSYVTTPQTFDELIDIDGYSPATCGCLMEGLSVDAVKAGLDDFVKELNL